MEYIYKFIEFAEESGMINLIFGGAIVAYLIHIYYKKEENEKYLALKLVGFFILGAFRLEFAFNWYPIIIPAGFLLYWFLLKNKERPNSIIKKKATILGVSILYLTILSNIIYDVADYRDMKFDIKNISMDTLKEDYETIKNELGLSWETKIINFEVKYDNNKKIKLLDMYIEDIEKNKFVSIGIYNGDYSVKQSKINNKDQILEHEFNTTTEELLEIIDNIELKKYDKADIYTIKYENDLSYIENKKAYIVNLPNYSTDKLYPNSEIINASGIMYIPMEKVSEGSWSYIDYEYYLTNYEISSSEENYKDLEITIENINNNKSVLIDDIYEKHKLMEELNSIHIARWNGENDIDLESDLFIKDNEGNRLGLCSKDKGLARRDIGETSVWYIVPSDLYDKINLYTMK
ncbi:hypothetical protein [Romboutsia sp. 1001713B170131_170501_G6]|uniref:hypothetical protein n=1 Tax=Romboutsia sp. 1001713B170131_170501_G6 TaxID=2787108 RepID=UPI0018AC6679|nr:hypothetical protein [Romboutsia sp. 1001713B170131_170501_G6]